MAEPAERAVWTAKPAQQEWGVIPGPVHRLLARLTEKARVIANSQEVSEWPPADVASDFDPFFRKTLAATQALHETTTDLRSLVSAWAHKYHQPKPNFSELARAQGATPQGLYKRYKQSTRDGIDELLSDKPDLAVILLAFPSLRLTDLRGLSDSIDRALAGIPQGLVPRPPGLSTDDYLGLVLRAIDTDAPKMVGPLDATQIRELLVEMNEER